MTEVTTFKTSEGVIYKTRNSSGNLSNKPREGTSCEVTFSVDPSVSCKLQNYESTYLLPNMTGINEESVKIQIGISSVSCVDRLIDICITTMNEGETSHFKLESSEGTELSFTACLESFDDFPEVFDLHDERKLEIAIQLKKSGIELHKKDKIVEAFHKFSKALKYMILLEDESVKSSNSDVVIALYCNLAGCHISKKSWEDAVKLCNLVLDKDSDNIKALYRRGWALMELNEFEQSKLDLSRALNLEPNNQSVKSKISLLNERVKQYDSKLSLAIKKMFT